MKKILFLLGTLLIFASSAMAYKLPRWSINPIDVYVPQTEQAMIVQQAFNTWSSKSGGLFRFRFLNTRFASTNADIIVEVLDEKAPNSIVTNSRRMESVGYFKNMPAGYIMKGNLTIYTMDKEGKPVKPDRTYASAMYEIGYIMGLEKAFESKDPKSIMNMQKAGTISIPSESDLKEIREIYTRASSVVEK